MSLIGALNISGNALATQQASLAVTGNNIANVDDPNYAREVAIETPGADVALDSGVSVGTGVDLTTVQRQVDEALQSRLNSSTADSASASTQSNYATQLQSVFNELSGSGLSTTLNSFFTSWSTLANTPQDSGQREIVIQDGQQLASQFNNISSQIGTIQTNLQTAVSGDVTQINSLAQQVATLNGQITVASASGSSNANSLEDQRAAAVSQLASLANVTSVPQANGTVNLYLGNETLVSATTARSLQVTTSADATGSATSQITFTDDNSSADSTSGDLGGLLTSQSQLNSTLQQVNQLAQATIFEVNKIHSSGQGLINVSSVTGTYGVADANAPLNSAAAGLTYTPTNGSFVVQVTANGQTSSTLVKVNLNGTGTQTTLNSLAATINSIPNVSASVVGGKLQINGASAAVTVSFSQDDSGTLAALGINTFFTGNYASDMAVNPVVANNTNAVNAAADGNPGDNSNAMAIYALNSQAVPELGNSISSTYDNMVTNIGAQLDQANTNVTSTKAVVSTLTSQQQSLSGVSVNEETINMLKEQTAFQAAARVVTTVDSMLTSLFDIT